MIKKFLAYFNRFKTSSRQVILYTLAVLFLVGFSYFIINSIAFLVANFNKTIIETPVRPPLVQFDTEGFEKLDL